MENYELGKVREILPGTLMQDNDCALFRRVRQEVDTKLMFDENGLPYITEEDGVDYPDWVHKEIKRYSNELGKQGSRQFRNTDVIMQCCRFIKQYC